MTAQSALASAAYLACNVLSLNSSLEIALELQPKQMPTEEAAREMPAADIERCTAACANEGQKLPMHYFMMLSACPLCNVLNLKGTYCSSNCAQSCCNSDRFLREKLQGKRPLQTWRCCAHSR